MKKTIAISIVASTILFGAGASATNLSTDQVNEAKNSNMTNATVNQGTMDITDTSTVTNYAHGGHGSEGANKNTIDGTTINGASESLITIDQGRLKATNGTTVNNSNDHSKNIIENGTIDATASSSITIKQGDIEINGGTYDNMEVHSINNMTDIDIDASNDVNTIVTQATLVVDANLTGGTGADYTKIITENTINQGSILNSTVKQAHTEIKSGAKVYGLDIDQVNTITAYNGDYSDMNGSTVLQGVTKIDGANTDVTNLKIDTRNNLNGVDTTSSFIVQNHTNIHSSSTVNGMTITTTGQHNTIQNVDATDSQISQNTINMENGSSVTNFSTTHNNIISNATLEGVHIGQDILDLNNSTLADGVAIQSTNKIDNITSIDKNDIHQAVTVVDSTTLNSSTSIVSNNTIEHIDLNNGDISQSYVSLVNNGNMGTLDLNNINLVTGVAVGGSDMNSSSISQAEFIMKNSTLTGSLTQDARSEVEKVDLSNSHIAQAKVSIGKSTVSNITLGNNTARITNDIDSPSITDSTVSQNGLKICNANVNTLTVAQDNDLNGGNIDHSTIVQGNINIEGTGTACVFASAEHAHKY